MSPLITRLGSHSIHSLGEFIKATGGGGLPVLGTLTWANNTSLQSTYFADIATSADGTKIAVWDFGPAGSLFKVSTDSGATYTTKTLPSTPYNYTLTMSADGTKLFFGSSSSNQINVSTDMGTSWSTYSHTFAYILSLNVSSDGSKIVLTDTTYLWYSNDSGATFNSIKTASGVFLKTHISRNGNIISLIDPYSPAYSLYITTNSGSSWTTIALPGYASGSVQQFDISDDGTIIVVSENKSSASIYISINSGSSWTTTTTSSYLITPIVSMDGQLIIVPINGSAQPYLSKDFGATIAQLSDPLTNGVWFAKSIIDSTDDIYAVITNTFIKGTW